MKNSSEVSQNGKLVEEKFIVEYKKELYDVTDFLAKHPGGINLRGYNHKNIEEKFVSAEHSSAAEYLLKEYKLRVRDGEPNKNDCDDSLEYLVDWKSALIPQISKLGDKYAEWVNKPVDRPMRLFSNPVLENLSKTPWYLPPLIWIPIIAFIISYECTSKQLNYSSICQQLISGVFLWTFIEYTMHRFVFHMKVEKHPAWSTFHFLLHGLHHKVPFDENRLVFPPVPAAIISIVLYQPVQLINFIFHNELFNSRLILAGVLTGYICYDMTHYYIHYGSPANKYFYHLKRYHYNHHFVNHDKGFGISSPLWDGIFGTKIILKKLKYLLKW